MANQTNVYNWGARLIDGVCATQDTTVANQQLIFNLSSPYAAVSGINSVNINFPGHARRLEFTAVGANTFTIKGAIFGYPITVTHIHGGGTSFTTNFFSDVYNITALIPAVGIQVGNAGMGYTMPLLINSYTLGSNLSWRTFIQISPVYYSIVASPVSNFDFKNNFLNSVTVPNQNVNPPSSPLASVGINATAAFNSSFPVNYNTNYVYLVFGINSVTYTNNPQNGSLTLTINTRMSE